MTDFRITTAPWYKDAFGALYPRIYAHRDEASAAPEAAFAAQCLALRPGDEVLDLCCGAGRHLAALRTSGVRLAGLDFSEELLRLARRRLDRGVRLTRGDMRALPFGVCFDAVTNFFTSFGYFDTDLENEGVLREIARVLRPGGRFFMDYMNPARVRAELVPDSRRNADGLDVVEHRWIDEDAKRVNKTIEVFEAGRSIARMRESVRLYELDEIETMCGRAGLAIVQVYGDYDGNPHGAERPRTILIGNRAYG